MEVMALSLLGWWVLSQLVFIVEHGFLYWHMKRLGISLSSWEAKVPRYLSEAYGAWGEANGVDVAYRLKIRKYVAVNWLLSLIGMAGGGVLLEMSSTPPSTLP